ncbi:thymus-specific serine protease [Electrophorus electricus]|uniref:Serine protease 16 n=1 Tax=Electrophorus electricus TaxID=8005 RepID=A0A4W4GCZ1_ELEEL|nr:thymus-specific serine protease [Electrophorus electricus]
MAFACKLLQNFLALFILALTVVCVPGEAAFSRFLKFKSASFPNSKYAVDENWFVQRLDHFNGADSRIWKQRYFVNDRFYKPGGPVFLMIGGEGPANPAWMQYGTWLTYAEKFGALCLLLEHRFYGKSHPTKDLSLESLRFLSSRQALADLAHFRTVTAESRGLTSSKWVAFGGSYPGSLAAWFRLKYPHLIHASVATSAPVYATANFPEYLEVVWRSLAAETPECPLLVKKASDTLIAHLKDPQTYDNVTKDFRLCSKLQIQSDMDSAYLLETLAGSFMDVVQYNEDNRAFEGVVGTNITVKVLCRLMLDSSLGDPYDRFAAVTRLLQDTFSQACTDVQYLHYLQDMSNTSWSGAEAGGGRQWVYQTCTEFGFYQSTDSPNQPFGGFPLPYYLQQCRDIYNLTGSVANAVQQTNEEYGGYDIRTTRIVFPNGSIDPWHALGVTSNITNDLPAVFIKGTAHCANMYPARAEDLPELMLARDQIFLLLQKWLKE